MTSASSTDVPSAGSTRAAEGPHSSDNSSSESPSSKSTPAETSPQAEILPRPLPFLRSGIAQALASLAAALVYVATLSFSFVYDDVAQILKNPAIQSWNFVPQYFTSHVWSAIYPNTPGNYYRPLFLLWLRLNYALFGTDAAGWHLTSIACHVLATWLVFRLAQKLSRDQLTAFLAALIFAVHPAHIENVAWISGVTDPLMTSCLLASLLAFLSFRDSRRPLHAAVSLTLFALALLAKETAVVLPLLIFAFVLIFEGDADSGKSASSEAPASRLPASRWFAALRACVAYLLLVALYAVVRLHALGSWSHPTIPIGWKEVLLTWPAVLSFYVRHLILPVHLSEFYSLDYVPHVTANDVLLPLSLVIAAVLALFLLCRSILGNETSGSSISIKNTALFACTLLAAPLLPVLDLRSLTTGDIVHDRYLYLPSAGFALLLALAIRELTLRLPEARRRFATVVAAVTLGASFAALTIVDQLPWANDIALYTRGVQSAPANLTVRDNLANAYLEAGQPARAIPLYLDVLARNPAFWRSNYNLGFAYYKTSDFSGAEKYLHNAIRLDPTDSDQYIYLALTELQLKNLPQAADSAKQAIARNPHARGYHYVLALIYQAQANRPQALAELQTEIADHPENTVAATALHDLEAPPSPAQP